MASIDDILDEIDKAQPSGGKVSKGTVRTGGSATNMPTTTTTIPSKGGIEDILNQIDAAQPITAAATGTSNRVRGVDREISGDYASAQRRALRAGVSDERVKEITSGKEDPGKVRKILGSVLNVDLLGRIPGTEIDLPGSFKPVKKLVIEPLTLVDTPRRAIISGINELIDLKPGGDEASFGDFLAQTRDTSYGFGTAFANPTGNKWLDRTIGLTGDILLDPITYLTFGTGAFVKAPASAALQAGVRATTKGTARAASREAVESGVRRVPVDLGKDATAAATKGLGVGQREAIEQIARQQRVGIRRTLGARSREDLAQGAREIREEAIELSRRSLDKTIRDNAESVANTLTDDVITDLATRGYAAARGDVAEVLGLRGGIRFGVGKAKAIIPGTERIADSAGALFSGLRVSGTRIPLTDVVIPGFVKTAAGKRIIQAITPIGDGGVFGSEDILRMRNALRTGTYEGRKLLGNEGEEFVKLLAADKAFRGLRAAQLLEGQQLIRPLLGQKEGQNVVDILEAGDVVRNAAGKEEVVAKFNLLDEALTIDEVGAKLGRPVTQAELDMARQWRKAGDEFYERANYLHARAQLAAGTPLELINPLPKNPVWFPHTLTDDAKRAVREGTLDPKPLGVDRSYALAGSNLRRLKADEIWFGYKLTASDIAKGVKRLNQIAREKGKLTYDVFDTNVDTAFTRYAEGWGRDTAYTQWLFNMALATADSTRGLPGYASRFDGLVGEIAASQGARAGFRFKGFQNLLTQEQATYAFGVPVPSKLRTFADAVTTTMTPERVAALNTVEGLRNEVGRIADEMTELALDVEKKITLNKGVFVDNVNQTLNDLEQRMFELQRLAPTVPAGYGAAVTAGDTALYDSLKNAADGLILNLNSVDPKKWVELVPLFLDNATQFLQINSRNYPGLIASPEVADMIKNFRRLEDPKFSAALNKMVGPITQMFKAWVTAYPGFHVRNALSNIFFMLSAGVDPVTLARGQKVYFAYTKYLKRMGLEEQLATGPKGSARVAAEREALALTDEIATGYAATRSVTDDLGIDEAARKFFERETIDTFAQNQRILSEFFDSPEWKKTGLDPFEVPGADPNATWIDILGQTQYGYNGVIGDIFETTSGRLGISGRLNDKAGKLNDASRVIGKIPGASRRVGNIIENWSRFMLTYDGIARGLSSESAAARTAKYLIDYQDLSTLDKNVRSIIPFWTWTSRSFPLIVESSWTNPRAYAMWNSITRNMTDKEGMEDQQRPYFLRASFKLPFGKNVYGNPDFGFQKQEESFASLTDPASIFSGVTPILRAPLEVGINQKFQTGKQVYNPYFDEGVSEGLKYILSESAGVGTAAERAAQQIPALLNLVGLTRAAQGLETAPGVGSLFGAPGYVEREKGPQSREASLQALARFLGLPVYQLQPYQIESALKEQIKLLEQEASRAEEKNKRRR